MTELVNPYELNNQIGTRSGCWNIFNGYYQEALEGNREAFSCALQDACAWYAKEYGPCEFQYLVFDTFADHFLDIWPKRG